MAEEYYEVGSHCGSKSPELPRNNECSQKTYFQRPRGFYKYSGGKICKKQEDYVLINSL